MSYVEELNLSTPVVILYDLAIQTSFHAEVLDCLIRNPMAWLLSFAMEKVIRIFSSVALGVQRK